MRRHDSRMIPRRTFLSGLSGVTLAAATAGPGRADAWPSHSVTIIVPYDPGASNDTFTRMLARILQKKFSQTFVIQNRAGASGFVGADQAARASADGYTFLESANSIAAFKTVLNLDLDATTQLQAVGMLARAPLAMVVPASLPVTSVQEFIGYAKKNPDSTFYGLAGIGTTQHFASEEFNLLTGISVGRINYKAQAEATTDLIANRVQMTFTTAASVLGQIKSGQLRVLAYCNNAFPAGSPPAPVMADIGIKGMEFAQAWWGIFAPKGLPPDILTTMNAAINEALKDPDMAGLIAASGAVVAPTTPDEFSKSVVSEAALIGKIMHDAKIQI